MDPTKSINVEITRQTQLCINNFQVKSLYIQRQLFASIKRLFTSKGHRGSGTEELQLICNNLNLLVPRPKPEQIAYYLTRLKINADTFIQQWEDYK